MHVNERGIVRVKSKRSFSHTFNSPSVISSHIGDKKNEKLDV